MSKRISSDIRKKVACALITSVVVGSTCGLASADNGYDNANYKNIGYVSVVGEVGVKGNAGFISTGEGDAGGKSYGVSQFTSKAGGASANGFVKWLKKHYPEMGKNFDGVGKAGSSSFDKAWKKTYSENKDEFGRVQMEYTGKNYVDPFVSKAKAQFGIDFKSTRALLELAYSTTVQFGVDGTLSVFKNAGINSNMSEVEILENATREKINSVGTYKFLGCNQDVRNSVKKRFARELEEFKDIVEGSANLEGVGKVTLDDLVNEENNKTSSSLDNLVNGENSNINSPLDNLVNGEADKTDSPLDNLVNGEIDDTDKDNNVNSPLDDLVNGEADKTDSPLDDLVNGETDNTDDEPTKDEPVKDKPSKNEPSLDDLINDENYPENEEEAPAVEESNKEELNSNDSVSKDVTEGNKENDTENSDTEVSNENESNLDKEQELNNSTSKDETENDDTGLNEYISNEGSSNEAQEDESMKDDKKDTTENKVENAISVETTIKADTVLSLEEKLENNMFGKLFKMTKEIMENENGVDGVRAMYDFL